MMKSFVSIAMGAALISGCAAAETASTESGSSAAAVKEQAFPPAPSQADIKQAELEFKSELSDPNLAAFCLISRSPSETADTKKANESAFEGFAIFRSKDGKALEHVYSKDPERVTSLIDSEANDVENKQYTITLKDDSPEFTRVVFSRVGDADASTSFGQYVTLATNKSVGTYGSCRLGPAATPKKP